MTTRRKGAKEEAAQDFSPWTLSIRSSLRSARTLRRLKSPLGVLDILADQHSIWIIFPRPNGAHIAQRACFDSLLETPGQLTRTRGDGFEYKLRGALGAYRISFRVLSVKDHFVARTTTRLKVFRPFHFAEGARDIYCLAPGLNPLSSSGKIHLSQIGPGSAATYFSSNNPTPGRPYTFKTSPR